MSEASPKLSTRILSIGAESYMLSKKISLTAMFSTSDQPPVKYDSSLAQRLFRTKSCSANLRNFTLQSFKDHFLVPMPNAQIPPKRDQTKVSGDGQCNTKSHYLYYFQPGGRRKKICEPSRVVRSYQADVRGSGVVQAL